MCYFLIKYYISRYMVAKMQNNTELNSSLAIFGPFAIVFYNVDGNLADNTMYTVKIILSTVLVISMVLSVIGNICTCTVIVQNRSMRTPTNCYLANIAITDLLISLFIPIEIFIIWISDFYPLDEVTCLSHFILLDSFSNCNLLSITAFTVERYIVVTKPFLRRKMLKKARVFKIIAIIWTISLSFCIPDIYYIGLTERKKYMHCYDSLLNFPRIIMGVEIFVFFIIPMITITVLYGLISYQLMSKQYKLRSPVNAKQNRDKAVTMFAVVAASFFFLWSPYCVLRIMMIYPDFKYEDNQTAWKIVNYLCYNGYISTAVNPIIYSLMSRKFRQAFKVFLRECRPLRKTETLRRSSTQQYKLDNIML